MQTKTTLARCQTKGWYALPTEQIEEQFLERYAVQLPHRHWKMLTVCLYALYQDALFSSVPRLLELYKGRVFQWIIGFIEKTLFEDVQSPFVGTVFVVAEGD